MHFARPVTRFRAQAEDRRSNRTGPLRGWALSCTGRGPPIEPHRSAARSGAVVAAESLWDGTARAGRALKTILKRLHRGRLASSCTAGRGMPAPLTRPSHNQRDDSRHRRELREAMMSPQVGAPLQALPVPPRQPARRGFRPRYIRCCTRPIVVAVCCAVVPFDDAAAPQPVPATGRATRDIQAHIYIDLVLSLNGSGASVRDITCLPSPRVVRVSPRRRKHVTERKVGRFASGTCTDEQAP